MVQIQAEGDRLVFEVHGWDKLWALRSRLEIPIEHVKGVRPDPAPAMGWFQAFKLAGTKIPNLFQAGTFYQDGGMVFWYDFRPCTRNVADAGIGIGMADDFQQRSCHHQVAQAARFDDDD